MGSFQEVLLILIFSFADLKLMSASYSWNVFSLQVGDIWKCHEVKHIMIMIITIIYTFLFYVIFHEQLKITFRKSSGLLKKSTPLFLLTAGLQNILRHHKKRMEKNRHFLLHLLQDAWNRKLISWAFHI